MHRSRNGIGKLCGEVRRWSEYVEEGIRDAEIMLSPRR